jgi:hypothetical protein
MPSSESLWIDEGVDSVYARQNNLSDWFSHIRSETKSQAQMPLPMLSIWAWAKLAGTSEYSLRAVNILWGGVTIFCLYLIGRKTDLKWIPLAAAAHPFLWFYTNEARPYAMQIAAATVLLWAFLSTVEKPSPRNLVIFLLSTWILSATSIINYVLAGLVTLSLLLWPDCRRLIFSKAALPAYLFGFAIHLPLIAYYMGTLLAGTGGVKNLIIQTGFASVVFAFYELSGFFGLGPGRDAIRETVTVNGLGGLTSLFADRIWLLLAAVACLLVSLHGFLINPKKIKLPRTLAVLLFCVFGFVGIILVAAIMKHTALWGRHLAAVFPFMVFAFCQFVSLSLNAADHQRSKLIVVLGAGGGAALLLLGSLLVRYGADFRKDDYRSATARAISAAENGKTVWWAAAIEVTEYYAGMDDPLDERFILMKDFKGEKFATAPEPDMIVLGRSSIYDVRGNIQEQAEALFGEKPDTSARNLRIWKDQP